MYKIKQTPQDFQVKEESNREITDEGEYIIARMKKTNYNTEDAVNRIANALNINRKNIGYAGAKDYSAITWQNISIRGTTKEKVEELKLKDIELQYIGKAKDPISLGDLDKNHFEITIRNIEKKPRAIKKITNYFGEQRFSKNNAEIGFAILKKDFKKAIELICETSRDDERIIREHLSKNLNDYVGALRLIPWKILTMYVHAIQSKIWNTAATECEKRNIKIKTLPLYGFGTEFDNEEVEEIYSEILKKENLSMQDFIVRAIPHLTSAGNEREVHSEINNLEIEELEDDELNQGMKKCIVKFSLSKGSYATEVIKEMMKD